MATFSERLRCLRKERDLSQMDLAKQLSISKSSINMYERGEREPCFETLESIADYFNVDMDYLLGKSNFKNKNAWLCSTDRAHEPIDSLKNILPTPKTYSVPLLGSIACGDPILAAENLDGEVDVPNHIHADFALRCKGDSMINARIFDGDIVYIRQQDMVENGEIAAVLVEDEATLKRVHLYDDHIVLSPENPTHRPFMFWGEEMNRIRILGKAIAFTSML